MEASVCGCPSLRKVWHEYVCVISHVTLEACGKRMQRRRPFQEVVWSGTLDSSIAPRCHQKCPENAAVFQERSGGEIVFFSGIAIRGTKRLSSVYTPSVLFGTRKTEIISVSVLVSVGYRFVFFCASLPQSHRILMISAPFERGDSGLSFNRCQNHQNPMRSEEVIHKRRRQTEIPKPPKPKPK